MPNIQCLCGDIELELAEDPVVQLYCHCDHCQLVHGAAMAPVSLYHTQAVQVVRGEPQEWRLVSAPRFSCGNCGTRLFIQGSPEIRGVNAYLLPEGSFRPSLHIYCKFARLPVQDGLPHYSGVPARWGGSDEMVLWPAPSTEAVRA
jgi:hypothetical protein